MISSSLIRSPTPCKSCLAMGTILSKRPPARLSPWAKSPAPSSSAISMPMAYQDFVVTNFKDNTFSLFLGNGDGTFKQATGSPFALPTTATGPIAMTSADFNSDGNLDLAIVNQTTNNVAILLGNGSGAFSLATGSPFAVGKSPVAIASADLNVDSHPDLAIVNQIGQYRQRVTGQWRRHVYFRRQTRRSLRAGADSRRHRRFQWRRPSRHCRDRPTNG